MGMTASAVAAASVAAGLAAVALFSGSAGRAHAPDTARLVSMNNAQVSQNGVCREPLWISIRRILGAPPPQGSPGEFCH
ncbi:MAG: hypothetical protein QM759_08870 [Terricaulis sp.]